MFEEAERSADEIIKTCHDPTQLVELYYGTLREDGGPSQDSEELDRLSEEQVLYVARPVIIHQLFRIGTDESFGALVGLMNDESLSFETYQAQCLIACLIECGPAVVKHLGAVKGNQESIVGHVLQEIGIRGH